MKNIFIKQGQDLIPANSWIDSTATLYPNFKRVVPTSFAVNRASLFRHLATTQTYKNILIFINNKRLYVLFN